MSAQLPTPAHQFGYRIMGPAQQVQSGLTGFTITSGQATILPHAFTVGMLHDPASGAWNMDTGASSHLNNSVNSLREIFNTCMYPSISVSDGHSIHVTNTGHSILPTPLKSLHLNNVLITPHIVKNLISDRQFFRDNNCIIEFDAFDFSVKDFMTRRVLLRCDSTGIFTQSQLHLLSLMLSLLVNICGINVLDTQGVMCCNGKSERMVPTINNLICTLLFQANLSPTFWVEARNKATHLLNILPSTVIASPSSGPTSLPSPVAQHTPVQLQFSPTAVPHQTITVSDQHAPSIVQNPLVSPNPNSVHPMVTRFRVRTNRPTKRLNLHVSSVSPLPKSYRDAFSDPNWQNAMRDEYHGTLSRYKARLVANGSTQLEGVDVDETFSPVVKPVYMHQPPGFQDFVHPDYGTDTTYLLLYVDDIVLTASSEILLQAHMVNCNLSRTPIDTESKLGSDGDPVSDPTLYRSLAGSLQYLTFTRPDISYAVQQVCLYMHDPREPYFSALKRILWYVRGTLDYGLQLFSSSTTDLVAYSDADWAGCPTTRRSTSGYCVFPSNNLLSWSSKRHLTLSRFSAEAEYRGVANVVAKTCWLCNLLRELHTPLSSATLVYCDNVRVLHVPSSYQFADIFTKVLHSALFEEFRTSLSVRCPSAPIAGEATLLDSQPWCIFDQFLFHENPYLGRAARARVCSHVGLETLLEMLGKTDRGENEDVDLHLVALINTNMGCDEFHDEDLKLNYPILSGASYYTCQPWRTYLLGTPPRDVIEEIAQTIVATIPNQKFKTEAATEDSTSAATVAEPKL
ncbi:ribonuclease H-like domain-containing protein [Tanacetum coccineum]|uniref:Ribonuclease H-like domain-containing protein n=1 Tax=Tanacetum coccineum TaxID=301880 RepID=A0ABQ5GLD5_9ASTR